MVAAISPQLIGIAVASAVVVILLVILVLRRSAEGKEAKRAVADAPPGPPPSPSAPAPAPMAAAPVAAPAAAPTGGSFLDEPLKTGFEGLGRPLTGQPALGTVVLPKDMRPPEPEPAPSAAAADFAAPATPPEPGLEPTAASPEPVEPTSPGPEPRAAAPETAGGEQAPLSDIIVTTNQQEIDLTDPDVRAMLEELVGDEIALAEVYQQQGQTLDAILQLTEAEKACTALGDTERAEKIKAMMKELQP